MTERRHSLMIPGELEARRRRTATESIPLPAKPSAISPVTNAVVPEWPMWARASSFVGLLLAATMLAMWAASIGTTH
jgi:hypothetical protein